MNRFLHGHATHPDWRVALALAAAQIDAQREQPGTAAAPTLGWVYLTDALAAHAAALLAELGRRWPGVEWVGASGVGIAAGGVEYFDEPALSLLLTDLAPAHFRVFSGARPLAGFAAHTANVHADPGTADLADLIHDMSARTATGYLFGGLASGRSHPLHVAGGVLSGGLSGVAFDRSVPLVSRVTQGCQPVGPQRRVSAAERNVVVTLDG
ncbi:MAG TPA: FIST N-terminal domain-containing protein, partial [Burkholderiaceae bacterium]|nr:FIST N-terminal domain-containing protein [Burkholderiaceae bacterium]